LGRIFQSRRWFIAAACCAFAVILNSSLTKFDDKYSVTYCDYHSELKRGPATEPIIPLGFEIADTFCSGLKLASERSKQPAAFFTERGLFARDGVPRILAIGMGLIAPGILLLAAAFLALNKGRSLSRTLAILVLATFGSLTLVMWVTAMALELPRTSMRYLLNYIWPLAIPVAFFGGAYWLSRKRSPKEAA
jgi:hypothetical protein